MGREERSLLISPEATIQITGSVEKFAPPLQITTPVIFTLKSHNAAK